MAILSDSRKWMFVHIPKNGGAAIHAFVDSFHVPETHVIMENEFIDRDVFPGESGIEKHSPASRFVAWMQTTGRVWDDYTSFAVIRDPVTRSQSVYRELLYNRDWASRAVSDEWWAEIEALDNVNEFITSGLYDPDGPLSITWTQRRFVTVDDDIVVRHLFTLEEMSYAVPRLLGLSGTVARFHVGNYVPAVFSTEALDILHERYADDFDLYEAVGS